MARNFLAPSAKKVLSNTLKNHNLPLFASPLKNPDLPLLANQESGINLK